MSALRRYGLASVTATRPSYLYNRRLWNLSWKSSQCLLPSYNVLDSRPCIVRNFTRCRSLTKQPDTQNARQSDGSVGNGLEAATPRKPATRKATSKASLRSAAVAAGVRSRQGYISRRGKTRYVDPEVETKEVNAYCAAELYNINKVRNILEAQGYRLDPFHTGLHDEVVHFQKAYLTTQASLEESKDATDFGDVFIFPSGTMVTWNLPQREAVPLLNGTLLRAAKGSHLDALEEESLSYLEDPSTEYSQIIGDTIVLGTKAIDSPSDGSDVKPSDGTSSRGYNSDTDVILAKIAFSSGLARSPKLAVLENQLNDAFEDTRAILIKLSSGGRLPFTKKFVIKKIADILSIRAQLNLYTDLTDTVPDMLWESRYELGLERYYDEVGRALDVDDRIDALNNKIQYTQDIATVLKEQLSEDHGIRLEWIIIILITIEVVFELRRLYYEHKEHNDPKSTENLLRRALQDPRFGEVIDIDQRS